MGRRLSMLGEWFRTSAINYAAGDYLLLNEWGRNVALAVTIPLAIISLGGFVWALFVWPVWLGLLAGIPLLAVGFFLAFWVISKSVPGKLRREE